MPSWTYQGATGAKKSMAEAVADVTKVIEGMPGAEIVTSRPTESEVGKGYYSTCDEKLEIRAGFRERNADGRSLFRVRDAAHGLCGRRRDSVSAGWVLRGIQERKSVSCVREHLHAGGSKAK